MFDDEKKLYKLILIGKLEPKVKIEYLKGEVIGYSFFEFDYQYNYGVNQRGVIFMDILGYPYEKVGNSEFLAAKNYAKENDVKVFPNKDSVQLFSEDTILVRLSEAL